ncbi:FAD:protein FMN transferase [Actinomadura madurae]|uniref:hypothetical protein n=1 Tax=Actinomadura madurae TaxID=1993 RepID=UPI00399B9BB6
MTHSTENFPLWGDVASVMVEEPGRLGAARRAVDRVIRDIDAACGARRDADLARVNAAAGRPVRIGATFLAVLWTALHACELTGGLVDPLVRADGAASGTVVIDDPPGTVTIPAGTTLDLWGLAVAFAADRAAEAAAGEAGCGVCVCFPGSVATAGRLPEAGWPVQMAGGHGRPHRDEPCRGQKIVLRAPGLATSFLPAPGRPARRLRATPTRLPRSAPRTGRAWPAAHERRPWHAVSVIGLCCVAAKAASIAALAAGNAAATWLGSRDLRARMVDADGEVTTVGNWPACPSRPPVASKRRPALSC